MPVSESFSVRQYIFERLRKEIPWIYEHDPEGSRRSIHGLLSDLNDWLVLFEQEERDGWRESGGHVRYLGSWLDNDGSFALGFCPENGGSHEVHKVYGDVEYVVLDDALYLAFKERRDNRNVPVHEMFFQKKDSSGLA